MPPDIAIRARFFYDEQFKLAIKTFISEGYRTKDISVSEEFIKTSEVAPIIINFLKDEIV